jgi:hypothetical protein
VARTSNFSGVVFCPRANPCAARVQQVEQVRALHDAIVARQHESRGDEPLGLFFPVVEVPAQGLDVGLLEVVARELAFVLQVDLPVGHAGRPEDVVDAVLLLRVHRQPLEAVRDLDGNRVQVDAAHLLEVGELRDLHAVEPDLPAEPPGAERGALPVVLDETDVVPFRVDADGLQRGEVRLLDVGGRRLDQDLVLVIMLESVRVLAVAAVGGPAGRLDVGRGPGLGPETAEERRGVERARAFFDVVRLPQEAALFRPEFFQRHDHFLERHGVLVSYFAAAAAWARSMNPRSLRS